MHFARFNQLDFLVQQHLVAQQGDYLATRLAGGEAVLLYHLPAHDFFVELYYERARNCILRLRAFAHAAPLEAYTGPIRLPDDRQS